MRLSLFCLLALGLNASVQAQALNQVYQVQGYSCYKAKDTAGEVVEYCTPVPAKSLEDFKVPMHGYLTEEGRLESARKYAKNKDNAIQKAKNPELSKPIIPVPAGVSGGRSGSTATSSAGGDLQRKNPQYVVEKAEIAAKQTAEQLNVDTRRLEKAKKELVSLQARVKETQAVAEAAAQEAARNPNDITIRQAREAEANARYHASRLQSSRLDVYEKRVAASAQKAEEARIKAEKARALFEAGETDIEAQLRAK